MPVPVGISGGLTAAQLTSAETCIIFSPLNQIIKKKAFCSPADVSINKNVPQAYHKQKR